LNQITDITDVAKQAAREAGTDIVAAMGGRSAGKAFRDGIVVEALNPKTAAFFLAFLPQFVDPAVGAVWLQFLVLGLVSVTLNTAVDIIVVITAARARSLARARPALLRRLRMGAGVAIASLGLSLLLARRPAAL